MYCSSRQCISKKVFSYPQDICCNKTTQFFKSSLCLYCNLYRCVHTSDIASDCCYDNIVGYLGFLSVISQPWLVNQTVHVGGGVGWVGVGGGFGGEVLCSCISCTLREEKDQTCESKGNVIFQL